jgi:solute carrier family 13 (sodium-dependent dicarboxylate transporter), member 2/3/5
MNYNKKIQLLLAIFASYSVRFWVNADENVQLGLAIFILIGWLWVSESLNITITALLIPVLAVITGIFELKAAFAQFSNPVIFLFMGGFALAAALQKHHIDRIIALKILSLSKGKPLATYLLLFMITAMLSMWISNTATIAMMLPLAIALLADKKPTEHQSLYAFVLLGLAYSGNLGGMATLIGSPPNAIAASAVGLNFQGWLKIGMPMFLLLFPLMIIILYLIFRPDFSGKIAITLPNKTINSQGKVVAAIFALTALSWMFSAKIATLFGLSGSIDAIISILAVIILVGSNSLKIEEFVAKTNWQILLLFGGGLTLSALLQSSGASSWLAQQISTHLPLNNAWLLLAIICLFVIFLTELVSNTASAALLVPLFISVASEFNLSTTGMAVVIALSASCAFMLPVATPPNAIVFSSGFIKQQTMMKTGAVLNICFAMVMATAAWMFI